MKIFWRIGAVVILVLLLVLVRQFERELFFDPFMAFFEGSYEAGEKIPLQWYLNLVFRFLLNTGISIGIIYLCFRNRGVVKFSLVLYGFLFLLLFPVFVFLMGEVHFGDYLPVFYIRRFLIHPVLLLLLIPAFFYQRIRSGKQE